MGYQPDRCRMLPQACRPPPLPWCTPQPRDGQGHGRFSLPSRQRGPPVRPCFTMSAGSSARLQRVFAYGATRDGDRFEVSSGRARTSVWGGSRVLSAPEQDGSRQELSVWCPVPRWGFAAVPMLGAGTALAPPPAALGNIGAPPGPALALGPIRLWRPCPTPWGPAPLQSLKPGILLRSPCHRTLPWRVASCYPQPQERRWLWEGPGAGEGQAPGFGVEWAWLEGGRGAFSRKRWPQPGLG